LESEKLIKLSAFQDLLLNLAEQHPDLEVFKNCQEFERIIFLDAENQIDNVQGLLKNTNSLLLKMTQISAIKQNQSFVTGFSLGEEASQSPQRQASAEGPARPGLKSGSLLRLSKKK